MARGAYDLQGLNGFDRVPDGSLFAGKTAGFQVTVSGTFTYSGKSPQNETVTFTSVALDPPSYIGGNIDSVEAGGGGECAVFPMNTSYSIGAA